MAKAADAFLTGRPYGIRLDFKHKGFALFNYNMNELGNHLPGRLETLPLEDFDVEDIPLCGERIVRKENITDIFFYDEKSNPYSVSSWNAPLKPFRLNSGMMRIAG